MRAVCRGQDRRRRRGRPPGPTGEGRGASLAWVRAPRAQSGGGDLGGDLRRASQGTGGGGSARSGRAPARGPVRWGHSGRGIDRGEGLHRCECGRFSLSVTTEGPVDVVYDAAAEADPENVASSAAWTASSRARRSLVVRPVGSRPIARWSSGSSTRGASGGPSPGHGRRGRAVFVWSGPTQRAAPRSWNCAGWPRSTPWVRSRRVRPGPCPPLRTVMPEGQQVEVRFRPGVPLSVQVVAKAVRRPGRRWNSPPRRDGGRPHTTGADGVGRFWLDPQDTGPFTAGGQDLDRRGATA